MKSGNRLQALLNYNALSEEMIFVDKDRKLAISREEKEKVDTVYIKGRKFLCLTAVFSSCYTNRDTSCTLNTSAM